MVGRCVVRCGVDLCSGCNHAVMANSPLLLPSQVTSNKLDADRAEMEKEKSKTRHARTQRAAMIAFYRWRSQSDRDLREGLRAVFTLARNAIDRSIATRVAGAAEAWFRTGGSDAATGLL